MCLTLFTYDVEYGVEIFISHSSPITGMLSRRASICKRHPLEYTTIVTQDEVQNK